MPTVSMSMSSTERWSKSYDCAEDGSQPPPPGLYLDHDLAPNRGVADSIGRATAATDEEDKLWRQSGVANEARNAPDSKDKGTDGLQ